MIPLVNTRRKTAFDPVALQRMRVIVAVLALVLAPLGALMAFTVVTVSDVLTTTTSEATRMHARATAVTAYEDLTGKLATLQSFARRRLLWEAIGKHDRAGIERHLRELGMLFSEFERVLIVDAAGILLADFPTIDNADIGRSFTQRQWYQAVIRAHTPYVSDVFLRTAEPIKPVFALAVPVIDERNELIGMVVLQETEDTLRQAILRLGGPVDASISVFDRNARRVFDIGPAILHQGLNIRPEFAALAAALQGRESVEILTHADGMKSVIATSPIAELGWAVMAQTPLSMVNESRYLIITRMSAVGVVLLMICGALGLRWAKTFAQNRELLSDSERLKREVEMQRNRYRALMESSSDGLAMTDTASVVQYFNGTFGRMLGIVDVNTLIGNRVTALHERVTSMLEDPTRYRSIVDRLWADPHATGDVELITKNGSAFHFYSAPVLDHSNVAIGRSLMCRDMTREREVERMKNEFVATVSHELRTPLASLLGFSELMLTRKLPEDKQRHFVEVIHVESKRLNVLINDFLDIQRLESGRALYHFETLDAVDMLRETAALFSNRPQHPLRVDVPEALPPIRADRDRIKQVLNNLLSNAIKYSPEGGEIVLSARCLPTAGVEIAVTDHGLGIPANAMPKLFGKFFRVDSSDRREIGGTGLGLALCKEVIEAHQGTIHVESVQGAGTTFRFTLPQAEIEMRVGAEQPAVAPDVLVVEDDSTFATLVREHLGELGLSVLIQSTAEGALHVLENSTPRLILLDIHLAGKMDGWDFLVAVKADPKLAPIPVIITTITEKQSRGIALGASDYLVKPFKLEVLMARVRQYLPRGSKSLVLVVDDDVAFRQALTETIRGDIGCTVDESGDGETALVKIRQRAPDLLILDLLMPGMDGIEVLDRVRKIPETVHLPVLVVTGKDLSELDKRRLSNGMARVLTKAEYQRERFLALVRELIGYPITPEATQAPSIISAQKPQDRLPHTSATAR